LPDAFTPGELGALQYPREGTDAEKRKACQNQGAMVDSIKAAIAADELTTVFRSVQVTIMETVPDYSAVKSSGTHEWLRRDGFTPTKQVKAGERTEEIPVVPCGAFATWLATQGESPGEHIRAWFDAKGAAPCKSRRWRDGKGWRAAEGRQGEQLQKIIDALLVWATKNGESFDSNSMPGQVGKADTAGSFHWLCAKLYPANSGREKGHSRGTGRGAVCFLPTPRQVISIAAPLTI
jgi:hypothetical protein